MTAASALQAWIEHTRASQQNRVKVQSSLMRMLHRTMYSAFAAWQEVAAEKALQRAKIAACVAHISNRVRPLHPLALHTLSSA